MREFEPKSLLKNDKDSIFASGKGLERFFTRVGLIAAGVGVSAVLLASII